LTHPPALPPNVFSLCNRPPWAVAALEFQDNPTALHIGRVRDDNRRLFARLDQEPAAERRGEIFHEYLTVQFALHQWQDYRACSRSSLLNSYIRYLRGWEVDSNSPEGAVLKGWVQSRLGIEPTFHHLPLNSEEAWSRLALDRMKGSARTNAINLQLDLLFEFCQYELARRRPDTRWITLYRGTYDASAYDHPGSDSGVVRFNNLSSFTSDRECAWEFGSTVWEVSVPHAKVFFFSGLLPESLLRGESEYLVIGGEYRVKKLLL
jgi:NAD+--dinitrogen-reductase ADP-D-ribosyltransferase